ncbi:poly-gamma-glutamate synthesis protein (capsule biosynthesis protein) [Caldalkalibacillus uzonensis]|uniref:Poly-gamma-glutamate synthesis protein (Capsule biosynthesis protein) n=1 Tax=Caldalkalibacillus uzonensis TaxID=353224 RepID=A0ABU0CV07_9BACI|nr:CapA family protein [Caldalkalibacillus uzonensis]MDQ0339724.1 poly-gamma-glutamate synthesis protein (capsule biosynthesis protein) [Caldalkalibacillus uzonensis]
MIILKPNIFIKLNFSKKLRLLCLLLLMFVLVSCQGEEMISQPDEPLDQMDLPEPDRPAAADNHAVRQYEDEVKQDSEKQDTDKQIDENKSMLRLMFVGDTMMTGNVAKVMDEKGNDYPLSEFMPFLEQADLVVANLETAVGTSGKLEDKTYAFQTEPSRFELFEPLKDKILFTLANNHGMDAPLDETMHELDQLGYSYIGVGHNLQQAFQPYVDEINGVSFAVIGVSRVIPTTDWVAGENKPGMASAYMDEPLLSVVEQWRSKVDMVIVYVHWGIEREDIPNDVQLELEEKLVSAGANIVVGSHPHVLQEIKWRDDDQITAFSLGNFVFTTSTTEKANYTIALDIQLTSEHITDVKIWPAKIDFGLIRYLDEAHHERQRVVDRLDQLSPTIHIKSDGQVLRRE